MLQPEKIYSIFLLLQEDLLTQVRTLKKRLKEAEEEQYRVGLHSNFHFFSSSTLNCSFPSLLLQAEEDAAALRAELSSIQQQEMRSHYNDVASMDRASDIQSLLETEILELKSQLQVQLVDIKK